MFKVSKRSSFLTAYFMVVLMGLLFCCSGNLVVNAKSVESLDANQGAVQEKQSTKALNEGMAEYGTQIQRRGFVQKDLDLLFPLGFGLDKFFPMPNTPATPAVAPLFSPAVIAQPIPLPVVAPTVILPVVLPPTPDNFDWLP
jgi:hypothetical protein